MTRSLGGSPLPLLVPSSPRVPPRFEINEVASQAGVDAPPVGDKAPDRLPISEPTDTPRRFRSAVANRAARP